jgi:hypothetical protein
MRFGSGALLVAAGLLVLWLAVSGKLSNLGGAWAILNGDALPGSESASAVTAPIINKVAQGFPLEAFPTLTPPQPTG